MIIMIMRAQIRVTLPLSPCPLLMSILRRWPGYNNDIMSIAGAQRSATFFTAIRQFSDCIAKIFARCCLWWLMVNPLPLIRTKNCRASRQNALGLRWGLIEWCDTVIRVMTKKMRHDTTRDLVRRCYFFILNPLNPKVMGDLVPSL